MRDNFCYTEGQSSGSKYQVQTFIPKSIYLHIMNRRMNEFPTVRLFGECANNLCRYVQEEDGTNEGK
jgi:hypothetical protein